MGYMGVLLLSQAIFYLLKGDYTPKPSNPKPYRGVGVSGLLTCGVGFQG